MSLQSMLNFEPGDKLLSTWPNLKDGRKIRILVTGPDIPDLSDAKACGAYIRKAVEDFFAAIDEDD